MFTCNCGQEITGVYYDYDDNVYYPVDHCIDCLQEKYTTTTTSSSINDTDDLPF